MTIIPPTPDADHDLDAVWAALDAALDVEEQRWQPAPGDKLTGTVQSLDVMPGNDGAYYVVRLDTRDGRRVSFPASRARLRNQLAAARVQPGDLLAVKYRGEAIAESSGRAFHDYTVAVHQVGPRDPLRAFQAEPPTPDGPGDLLPPPVDSDPADAPPFVPAEAFDQPGF